MPCIHVVDEASHPRKKRLVTATTVEKWISEMTNIEYNFWLKYELADRSYVSSLKCSKCAQFSSQLD